MADRQQAHGDAARQGSFDERWARSCQVIKTLLDVTLDHLARDRRVRDEALRPEFQRGVDEITKGLPE